MGPCDVSSQGLSVLKCTQGEYILEARLEGPECLDPMGLKDMESKHLISINLLLMNFNEDMVTGAITELKGWF